MKIVQSIWSKPSAMVGGHRNFTGRWPHPAYHWHSWIISTGWAARHYGNVELVTDHEGAKFFVDKLKLPFSSVRTDLQSLDAPGGLWAYGKVVAYALQEEPFFHIDGDVYLTGKLPARLEDADILCQFIEREPEYAAFKRVYDDTRQLFEHCLPALPSCWKYTAENAAGNCGIFGGKNIGAIKEYAEVVKRVVTHPSNQDGWRKFHGLHNYVNCTLEQQLLWCSAREQGVPITCVFDLADYRDERTLRAKALETNFNHAAGEGKNKMFGDILAQRVEAEFPEQFRIVRDLCAPVRFDL